ncbi:g2662 [Coccomyxa elongata]
MDMHHDGRCLAVGSTGGSVLLYDVRKLGGSSLDRLNLRSKEHVNEIQWQPEAGFTATQHHQTLSRMGRFAALTHAQAVARRKGVSAPFTSLDNQAVAPGAPPLEDVWCLATPCFHPPKVASVTQVKKQSMGQLSKDSQLNEAKVQRKPQVSAMPSSEVEENRPVNLARAASCKGLQDNLGLSRRLISTSPTSTITPVPEEAAGPAGSQMEGHPSTSAPLPSVPCAPSPDLGMELREDMRRLHVEMVRQLHLQQVDFLGMMEAVANRQECLEQRIVDLATKVQKLLQL